MLKHYLKYSYQILRKDKLFTLLNILGFAIGITVCSVIAFFVVYEYSFDAYNKNYNNTYVIIHNAGKDKFQATTTFTLKQEIKGKIPGVKKIARISDFWWTSVGIVKNDQIFKVENCRYADPEIFDIFDFNFISGSKENFASKINSVLLSQSIAKKYQNGNEQLVGKTIEIKAGDNKGKLEIAGVFKDLPENSNLKMDVIVQIAKRNDKDTTASAFNWKGDTRTFLALDSPALKNTVENQINRIVPDSLKEKHYLLPIANQRLYAKNITSLLSEQGDLSKIYIYSVIGLLTLLIACINYINFSTAKSAMRAKEIGIRKIAGANRRDLIKQLTLEPVILALATLPIVIGLLILVSPYSEVLFGKEIKADFFLNWNYLFALIGIIIFTGVASAHIPHYLFRLTNH